MPLSDWWEPVGCSELYESQMMHWFSRARREGTVRSHCKNTRLLMTHAGRHQAVRDIMPLWKSQQLHFVHNILTDTQDTVAVNMHFYKKEAVSLFTPSRMTVYLNAGLQTLPPINCQCAKCQHGRVHWLSSHKNMPSSRVMVFDAPPCEGKHIKHIRAHVICARLRSNRVCILFDKRCKYFRPSFYLGCWIRRLPL